MSVLVRAAAGERMMITRAVTSALTCHRHQSSPRPRGLTASSSGRTPLASTPSISVTQRGRHGASWPPHGAAARATVDGDPGPTSPGLDAVSLLIRGEGIQGECLDSTLANAGLSDTQRDEVMRAHPRLQSYDLLQEVQPRINYVKFLADNDRLGGESVVECIMRQPQSLEKNYSLVHECDHFSVVNKPWCVRLDTPRGWPGKVRFTPKYPGDMSVEDWLEQKYPNWDTVRFCHQLDNATSCQPYTSGVLVAASSKRAAGAAAKLFRERKARKTYLAIVFGHPESDEWSCDAPMGKDPDDAKGFREKVDESETGKACETRFEVLQRGVCALEGKYKGTPVSKVRVTPVTGRRHQIRVHLMHSGHPIVGDNAYSEDRDSFRTFLHAHVLEMPFEPPKNERNLPPVVPEEWVTHRWVAPEPESFAAAIE